MSSLHLYDFGIFLELTPDEEEKAMLENNIQVALAQQNINLEDAIDLREIKNVKLANQLLKIRRNKKLKQDQLMQQQNIQLQQQAAQQTAAAQAQMDVQKQQSAMQMEMQMEQMKAQLGNETEKEDRKDERTKIQATQQSELIEQRTNKSAPKNFESSGNDVMTGGFNLGNFEPR